MRFVAKLVAVIVLAVTSINSAAFARDLEFAPRLTPSAFAGLQFRWGLSGDQRQRNPQAGVVLGLTNGGSGSASLRTANLAELRLSARGPSLRLAGMDIGNETRLQFGEAGQNNGGNGWLYVLGGFAVAGGVALAASNSGSDPEPPVPCPACFPDRPCPPCP